MAIAAAVAAAGGCAVDLGVSQLFPTRKPAVNGQTAQGSPTPGIAPTGSGSQTSSGGTTGSAEPTVSPAASGSFEAAVDSWSPPTATVEVVR